jgi:uncharacterized protein
MNSLERLISILRGYPSILLAYSGGIDSTLLLELLKVQAGIRFQAVFVEHPGLTGNERDVARAEIDAVQGQVISVSLDEMQPVWGEDRAERCYYCKKFIFSQLLNLAEKTKLAVVIDGSHAEDDPGCRPGMRVLDELGIKSPLREAGWNKRLIRKQAKVMGVKSWDRPARACLATGIEGLVTQCKLEQINRVEVFFQQQAVAPVRVRLEEGRLGIGTLACHGEKIKELLATPAFQQLLDSLGRTVVEVYPLSGGATR